VYEEKRREDKEKEENEVCYACICKRKGNGVNCKDQNPKSKG
jgi:hypothetical protein